MTLQQYRRERLKTAMAQAGADLLIASVPQHILYVSGFIGLGATYHPKTQNYALYDPSAEKLYIVVSVSDAPTAMDLAPDAEIVAHGSFRFAMGETSSAYCDSFKNRVSYHAANQVEALSDILTRCGAKDKTVAWDELRTPVTTWNAVANQFPETRFVPALSIFESARSVKHPDEIADLERAANIAEDALLSALRDVKVGTSECDIRYAYMREVSARCGDTFFMTSTIDRRTSCSDTVATSTQKVRDGSVMRFDYGACYHFMCSDLARTAVFGTPDPRCVSAYASILDGLEAAEAMMKPGIPAKAVFEAASQAAKRTLPIFSRHHCGHGIGVMINDIPVLTPTAERILEPGMVFSLETPFYILDDFGVQIEDMVVVTETGIRRLCHTSNELIRL